MAWTAKEGPPAVHRPVARQPRFDHGLLNNVRSLAGGHPTLASGNSRGRKKIGDSSTVRRAAANCFWKEIRTRSAGQTRRAGRKPGSKRTRPGSEHAFEPSSQLENGRAQKNSSSLEHDRVALSVGGTQSGGFERISAKA